MSWIFFGGREKPANRVIKIPGALYDSFNKSRCLLLSCNLVFDASEMSLTFLSTSPIPESVTEYTFNVSAEMRLQRSLDKPPQLRWFSIHDSSTIPPFFFVFEEDQNPLIDDLHNTIVESARERNPNDRNLERYVTIVESFYDEDEQRLQKENINSIDLRDADLIFSDDEASFYVFEESTETFKIHTKVISMHIYERNPPREARALESVVARFILCLIVDENTFTQVISSEMLATLYQQTQSMVWHIDSGNMVSVVFGSGEKFDEFRGVFVKCLFEPYFSLKNTNRQEMEWLGRSLIQDFGASDVLPKVIVDSDSDSDSASVASSEVSMQSCVDEEDPELKELFSGGDARSSLLGVGWDGKNAFVSRGSKLGVFSLNRNDISVVSLNDIQKPGKGSNLLPTHMMAHDKDRDMFFIDGVKTESLFRMDLSRGEVVEEWQSADRDGNRSVVTALTPQTKDGVSLGEKTFLGINEKKIMLYDPRLPSKSKIADSVKYSTNMGLSCIAATEKGEYAIGTKLGEVKLFRHTLWNTMVGKARAMTNFPGIGEEMKAIDVSKNGKWVLCTYKTFLMLISTETSDGSTGFQRRMKDEEKKPPIRLSLKPRDIRKVGGSVNFVHARFNIASDKEEDVIVSSTGRSLVLWDFKTLKRRGTIKYMINEMEESIIDSNFVHNDNENIVSVSSHSVSTHKAKK